MPTRNLPARYNICPTQTIDTVIEREGKRDLALMRWGLVPSWWKKTVKETPSTFNARAETVAEKPMFRAAFKRNRCLIPASGYYEWKSTSQVHDRMPVLLQPRDFDRWLAATAGTELLKPAANDYLQVWPVSRRVNSSRAPGDDSTLIEAIQ
jgi:putative SOS response-associated peptidase YedK